MIHAKLRQHFLASDFNRDTEIPGFKAGDACPLCFVADGGSLKKGDYYEFRRYRVGIDFSGFGTADDAGTGLLLRRYG